MSTMNTCFVIGPMNDLHMPTLKWLAQEVLAPVLDPHQLKVETPDSFLVGNIMDQVIKSCDRAPLVVADTTGNNPNVLYEMAILDAMGRACIPIKIRGTAEAARDLDIATGQSAAQPKDSMPFDRAAYRYFEIDRNNTPEAQEKMKQVVAGALQIRQKGDLFENPVTNFFGVPLSSFSSAYALARGYYYNLLKPAVQGITDGRILDRTVPDSELATLKLDCVIPDELEKASRRSVEELLRQKKIEPIIIKAAGREIRLYAWAATAGEPLRLVDIPTTMIALTETVHGRLGKASAKNVQPDSSEYKELQEDEVSQFERYLGGFLTAETDAWDLKRVNIIRWSRSRLAG
jgi:Prokaryotic STING domain